MTTRGHCSPTMDAMQTAVSESQTSPVVKTPAGAALEVVVAGKIYLTEAGLAKLLGKSPRTIARWEAARMGPPRITVGRTILYDQDKLPDWLARNETKPEGSRRSRRSAA